MSSDPIKPILCSAGFMGYHFNLQLPPQLNPKKVTPRLRCSLVNALRALTLATNFLRVCLRYKDAMQKKASIKEWME